MADAETDDQNPPQRAPDAASLFCPRCQSWDLQTATDEDALVCRCNTCETEFIVTNRPLSGFWHR
jgi:hypothetical protein